MKQFSTIRGYALHRLNIMRTRNILTAFFSLCAFPILVIGGILRSADFDLAKLTYDHGNNQPIFTVCIIVCAVCLSLLLFILFSNGILSYNYNLERKEIDKSHSLPIRYRERFWVDFITGLLPVVVFYTVGTGLGLFLLETFKTPELEYIIGNTADWSKYIWMFALSGLFFLIMTYVFVVFSASVCGRMLEAGIFALFIGILPAAIVFLSGTLMFKDVSWVVNINPVLNDIIAIISPAGFVINAFIASSGSSFYSFETIKDFPAYRIEIMLPIFLVLIGITAASYFIGKHRKAEKIGEAFAVRYAYNIILGLVMFVLVAFFIGANSLNDGFFPIAIITAIAFFLIEVITKRGIKKPKVMLVRYGGMVVSSFIVSFIFISFNGFGSAKYIPAIEEIESVGIVGNSFRNVNFSTTYYDISQSFVANFNIEDENEKKIAEYIRNLHAESVSGLNSDIYSTEYMYVIYKLKDGRQVIRGINFDRLKTYTLINNQSFKEKQIEHFDKFIYDKQCSFLDYKLKTLNSDRFNHNFEYKNSTHENAITKALYEAIKKDYLEENEPENIAVNKNTALVTIIDIRLEQRESEYMRYNYDLQFYIKPSYSNTLEILNKYDIEIPDIIDNLEEKPVYLRNFDYIDFSILNVHVEQCVSLTEAAVEGDERALKLLSVMQPICLVDDSGYGIIVGYDTRYVIPPEYKEMAEELYYELKDKGLTVYFDNWFNPVSEVEYIQWTS